MPYPHSSKSPLEKFATTVRIRKVEILECLACGDVRQAVAKLNDLDGQANSILRRQGSEPEDPNDT